jgi:hypothetical protein
MPEEVKRKISEAQKGRKMSPEHYANYLANRVNGMEGKKQSEHFKQRMSEVHSGKTISPDQVKKYQQTRHANQLARFQHNTFAKNDIENQLSESDEVGSE